MLLLHFEITIAIGINGEQFCIWHSYSLDNAQTVFTYEFTRSTIFCQPASLALLCVSVSPLAVSVSLVCIQQRCTTASATANKKKLIIKKMFFFFKSRRMIYSAAECSLCQ